MRVQHQIHSLIYLLLSAGSLANASTTTSSLGWLCPTNIPEFQKYQVCVDSEVYPTQCLGNTGTSSVPSIYNDYACSCVREHIISSCMQPYCPQQLTLDVLPYVNYYCALATGGSPTLSFPTVTPTPTGDREVIPTVAKTTARPVGTSGNGNAIPTAPSSGGGGNGGSGSSSSSTTDKSAAANRNKIGASNLEAGLAVGVVVVCGMLMGIL